jgi:PIN domain nuclease of toxin-antitoxin system
LRYLLDTHFLLWIPIDSRRINAKARAILSNLENEFVFSASSIWEIAIKSGANHGSFHFDPRELRKQLLENGYEELPVLGEHVVAVDLLPPLHKDPFDRILIAQAMVERVTLLTADAVIAKYPGPIRKV